MANHPGSTKICINCSKIKEFLEYPKVKGKNEIIYFKNKCKQCYSEYNSKYYIDNLEYFDSHNREYWENNREELVIRNKLYKLNNKDKVDETRKKYRDNNKIHLNEKRAERAKFLRKTDQIFKLKEIVSSTIRSALRKAGSTKNGNSILDVLPYTIEQLKIYLESQFESWMSWENWGVYDATTWKDDDTTTWTWQIDHIIPQANLPYESMSDENFQKCWALINLRPYSAKSNVLDGVKKSRK